ncbi:transcription factor grauzone-like [Bactrocera neohumeralis]|uniref:transcription factor grauzone-like n=1 Tax=Bactrocera neohumeralis TaxID=98809 RepID=UPI00216575DF|nr:transcription factor grauzone-like [Bactrocera neohumeralis]
MMFDKLSCLLCLEKNNVSNGQINIESDDPQAVKARAMVEQHFKEELSMKPYLTNKVLCQQCWELLLSFHEFYVRVQNAHLTATNTLKSLQELEIAVTEIKMEPDALDELASPPKRRRGRPRREKPNEHVLESQPSIVLKECSVRIEPLTFPYNSNINKTEDKNLEFLEVKSEVIPDENESIDPIYSPQMSNNESESGIAVVPTSPAKNLETGAPQKQKTVRTKKRQKRKRTEKNSKALNTGIKNELNTQRNKTSDYDEFIAKNFKLTCALCENPLENFRELKIHFREEHQTNGYVKCCGKKLIRRGVLVDHIKFHTNPEYFKCEHCEKLFADGRGLEAHLQFSHGSRERIYRCDICSKGFFRRELLTRHYVIHAPEEQKNIKCPQCEKTFCYKYNMLQHLKIVHLHSYSKICDICGKSFHGGEAFRRHQQEHAGIPRLPIKCELCNAELTTKYGLARHMKVMHTEEYQTPQVCPVCSKISPSLRAHHTHFKFMHATEKKHSCKMCDKAFKRPKDLREHMTTHTGEVLYTCTFCPQTFNSNANMYAHRKRKHPKEWAEKCAKRNTSIGMGQQIQKDLESIIESVKDTDETN